MPPRRVLVVDAAAPVGHPVARGPSRERLATRGATDGREPIGAGTVNARQLTLADVADPVAAEPLVDIGAGL